MAPLLGGSISWEVDKRFEAGSRRVTLAMSSAFVQDSHCHYPVGGSVSCSHESCAANGLCSIAEVHGVLCVAQLVPAGQGEFGLKYTAGDGSQCLHDGNLPSALVHGGGSVPGSERVGKANTFKITSVHGGEGGGVSQFSFSRNLTGTNVVVGTLKHVVVVDHAAEGLLAWLAPRAGMGNLATAHGLLLPQCSDSSVVPCSINVEIAGGKSGFYRTAGASPPPAPAIMSSVDKYWENFTASIFDNGVSNTSWDSFRRATPALETYVALCSIGPGGRRSCPTSNITNFHSPRASFPFVVEVPVTPRAALELGARFQGTGTHSFSAPHPAVQFKTYDADG